MAAHIQMVGLNGLKKSKEFMPGAKEFMEYALSKGVEVFFVTNRVLEIEQATINNFSKLGFKLSSKLILYCQKERTVGALIKLPEENL